MSETQSSLPRAVREAAERADEALRAQGVNPVADSTLAPEPPAPSAPSAPSAPAAPVVPPAPAAPAPVPAPEPATPTAEEWEHRYKSLKGRYDAEIPELRGQLGGLRDLIASMQTHAEPPKVEPARPESIELTPNEAADYGPDFVGVVKKIAAGVVRAELAGVRADLGRVHETVQSVTTRTEQSDREKMLGELTAAVPDWRVQNGDQEFLGWLAQRDPYSGMERGAMLRQAFEHNDAARVVAFFKGFRTEKAALAPPDNQPGTSVVVAAEPSAAAPERISLEQLAAPGRATAGANGSPQKSKLGFTHAQIATFYRDVTRGAYTGREAEQKATEAAIFAASREGRVR